MKNFKLFLLSLVCITSVLISCTNDEPLVEEQNIEDSQSITVSLAELRLQFNAQGNLIPTENPTGNIVFDFCFDFVYPLNLSYNNGTTVTVNSLDELISIIINFNNDLYINGIEFPFDVETYNDTSDAIVVVTINNEEEFAALIENCGFDNGFDCECYENYDPVCVEIEAPDGETFLMTYPNACYAECDGFTEDDFAQNCESDYNSPGGTDCFEFNFPITIITDNGDTIVVNSQEELDNALYNSYYFDFVYSFDVTLSDGTLLSIGNEEAFLELLEYCFGNDDDCLCQDEAIDPVCVEIELPNGNTSIITYPNACYAECDGFTETDFINCNNTNPSDCNEDDITAYLQECQWYSFTSLYDNVIPEYFEFNLDGSWTVVNSETGTSANVGSWSLSQDPVTNEVTMSFSSNMEPYSLIAALDWTVFICNETYIELHSNNDILGLERSCD
ncbi:hypothetical protein [Psychroserpens algicola]|uniref:Kazal-like domain-containing protein n=1 Tax=Psychroserpens algicola TaxID=1719034 RepID=A0ABT0HCE4_9FLAO|nr:hypothetical protein [Psychroserpens algicola]MCK8482033.1 hypothetical protein [Psychroserpens algicola]